MFVNFLYDALNDFGKLTTAGDFPNVINMGEASAERLAVDLKLPAGDLESGSVTLSIKGSDTKAGTYTAIVTGSAVTAAALSEDGYSLPMPKTKFKFLKASLTGTFSGTVQALINSYKGI
jgi:hypothetical protein